MPILSNLETSRAGVSPKDPPNSSGLTETAAIHQRRSSSGNLLERTSLLSRVGQPSPDQVNGSHGPLANLGRLDTTSMPRGGSSGLLTTGSLFDIRTGGGNPTNHSASHSPPDPGRYGAFTTDMGLNHPPASAGLFSHRDTFLRSGSAVPTSTSPFGSKLGTMGGGGGITPQTSSTQNNSQNFQSQPTSPNAMIQGGYSAELMNFVRSVPASRRNSGEFPSILQGLDALNLAADHNSVGLGGLSRNSSAVHLGGGDRMFDLYGQSPELPADIAEKLLEDDVDLVIGQTPPSMPSDHGMYLRSAKDKDGLINLSRVDSFPGLMSSSSAMDPGVWHPNASKDNAGTGNARNSRPRLPSQSRMEQVFQTNRPSTLLSTGDSMPMSHGLRDPQSAVYSVGPPSSGLLRTQSQRLAELDVHSTGTLTPAVSAVCRTDNGPARPSLPRNVSMPTLNQYPFGNGLGSLTMGGGGRPHGSGGVMNNSSLNHANSSSVYLPDSANHVGNGGMGLGHMNVNDPTGLSSRVCRTFRATGYCPNGDQCAFLHTHHPTLDALAINRYPSVSQHGPLSPTTPNTAGGPLGGSAGFPPSNNVKFDHRVGDHFMNMAGGDNNGNIVAGTGLVSPLSGPTGVSSALHSGMTRSTGLPTGHSSGMFGSHSTSSLLGNGNNNTGGPQQGGNGNSGLNPNANPLHHHSMSHRGPGVTSAGLSSNLPHCMSRGRGGGNRGTRHFGGSNHHHHHNQHHHPHHHLPPGGNASAMSGDSGHGPNGKQSTGMGNHNNPGGGNSHHIHHAAGGGGGGHPLKPSTKRAGAGMEQEANRFHGATLDKFVGEMYALAKDQFGCRFLQKQLEEDPENNVSPIFEEVFPYLSELMVDPFGNYLCQKLMEHCDDEQRTRIVEKVAPDLLSISLNMHGTRAVQKMIEHLSNSAQVQAVVNAFQANVVALVQDLNGNHVIQKCLNRLTSEENQFIYDAVSARCHDVATHRHGCCVFQRCIDHASEPQKRQLVREVTVNGLLLVQDPYGNYVVQYVLDLERPEFTNPLTRQFTHHVFALSVQKYSSNVIEKCIRLAENSTRRLLIADLLATPGLEQLLKDSYANYVIQTALDYADTEQRGQLVDVIRPLLPAIRNTPYGKRIQSKIQRDLNQAAGNGGSAELTTVGGMIDLTLMHNGTNSAPHSRSTSPQSHPRRKHHALSSASVSTHYPGTMLNSTPFYPHAGGAPPVSTITATLAQPLTSPPPSHSSK
ncbi:hypothetical protein IWQ61_003348 [Dispira simplex]|nr:hypothetical protein IWQ61_003348 [Dispira simplex]